MCGISRCGLLELWTNSACANTVCMSFRILVSILVSSFFCICVRCICVCDFVCVFELWVVLTCRHVQIRSMLSCLFWNSNWDWIWFWIGIWIAFLVITLFVIFWCLGGVSGALILWYFGVLERSWDVFGVFGGLWEGKVAKLRASLLLLARLGEPLEPMGCCLGGLGDSCWGTWEHLKGEEWGFCWNTGNPWKPQENTGFWWF